MIRLDPPVRLLQAASPKTPLGGATYLAGAPRLGRVSQADGFDQAHAKATLDRWVLDLSRRFKILRPRLVAIDLLPEAAAPTGDEDPGAAHAERDLDAVAEALQPGAEDLHDWFAGTSRLGLRFDAKPSMHARAEFLRRSFAAADDGGRP